MDKKKAQSLLNHPLLISIFTCLCLLAIFSLKESSKKALISKESIEKLEKNIEVLEQEVAKEDEKLKISQEPIALEKIIRNELLLKKDGEIILQIPDEEGQTEEINLESKKNGPWEEWKKMFER